jgi:hypothetical protein
MPFEHLDCGPYVPLGKRRLLRRRRNLLFCVLAAFSILFLLGCSQKLSGFWYCQFLQKSLTPSVHLVIAATNSSDLEWTKKIPSPKTASNPLHRGRPDYKIPPNNKARQRGNGVPKISLRFLRQATRHLHFHARVKSVLAHRWGPWVQYRIRNRASRS